MCPVSDGCWYNHKSCKATHLQHETEKVEMETVYDIIAPNAQVPKRSAALATLGSSWKGRKVVQVEVYYARC